MIQRPHSDFYTSVCFTVLSGSDTVTHWSLVDLFRIFLNSFDVEESCHAEEVCHFWNRIVKKGSELEHCRLQYSSVPLNQWTRQLLMHHLMNVAGRGIYCISLRN